MLILLLRIHLILSVFSVLLTYKYLPGSVNHFVTIHCPLLSITLSKRFDGRAPNKAKGAFKNLNTYILYFPLKIDCLKELLFDYLVITFLE